MLNLVFDFDGVIGDTWESMGHALVKSGRAENIEKAVENMTNYFSKRPHHANGHSMTKEALAEEYRWTTDNGRYVHERGFKLFDDFVDEIEKIETNNKAIVSSGSQNYVLPAIAKTNINPTHILAFEDHHSKEEKIEMICQDWGVDVGEVYYFTDTLADVYELKDLISKDKLIGVSWGYCSKEQLLTKLDEKFILDLPSDLSKILG